MTGEAATLIVVRHGETLWNVQSRYQGHGDSDMTATGRRQAGAVGWRLATMALDRLFASDLGRTRETAAIISRCTGLVPVLDARLRERNFGVLEGLTLAEIQARHPEVFARLEANDPDFVIPGGESLRQHYRRNADFLEDPGCVPPGGTVAVVAHGGVLDSVHRYVSGITLHRPRSVVVANASISVFRYGLFYGTRRWVLDRWGDVGHLSGIGHRSEG